MWGRRRKVPSGRSGNHTDRGWFVAMGEGIPARARATDGDIRDLAPTVLRWLGATPPSDYMGRALPELVAVRVTSVGATPRPAGRIAASRR